MSLYIQAYSVKSNPKLSLLGYNIQVKRNDLKSHFDSKKIAYEPDTGGAQGSFLPMMAMAAEVENQDSAFSINRTDSNYEGISIKKDDLSKLSNILKKLDVEIRVNSSQAIMV